MIKVVVCEGEGTLGLGGYKLSDQLQAQVVDLVGALKLVGVRLAVTSNASSVTEVLNRFRKAGLPSPDFVVTRAEVGKRKPSALFVEKVEELAGVDPQEIVYLGDDDNTDAFCAINANVLPFAAQYSRSPTDRNYGLPIAEPREFQEYLLTFGIQPDPYFGWRYQGDCTDTGKTIDVRVLLGDHAWLTPVLKTVLKQQSDVHTGNRGVSVRWLLFNYLVSQTYLSGLTQGIDWLAVYPGHKASSMNPTMEQFSEMLAPVFKDRFVRDLLLRHKDAPKSQLSPGPHRDIFDQFETIQVNPDYRGRLDGRSVLVLDEFSTSGHSLETARRMLVQAGAGRVVCVAVAKYGAVHSTTRVSESWDPFAPCTLARDEIAVVDRYGTFNEDADAYFRTKIWSVFAS